MGILNNLFSSSSACIAALIAAAVILSFVLRIFISRRILARRIKAVLDKPELAGSLIKNRYSKSYLLLNSRMFDNFARKHGPEILQVTGVDELWIDRLLRKKRKSDFSRVMKYSMDKGLFKCFLVSIENKSLAGILIRMLEETGDFLYMRKLAMAGKGEDFDSVKAHRMFSAHLPEIREMT